MDAAKRIALFESTPFDTWWPEGHGWRDSPPLGRDCAEFLRTRLLEKQVPVPSGQPTHDEFGWNLDLAIGRRQYTFFVHLMAIGRPPRDCWVVQVYVRTGCLSLFLAKQPSADALEPAVALLGRILDEEEEITKVRWVNDDEFGEL